MNFDRIRPYFDSEIQPVFERLISDSEVLKSASMIMPLYLIEDFKLNYKNIMDIGTFQYRYMLPMLEYLIGLKQTNITFSGIKNMIEPSLLISNHRDIIMDPAFLQYVLLKNSFKTSEIAIGNNLIVKPWIADAMKINKSFIVRRNIPKGEQISSFVELSSYIHYAITDKHQSVWLAHREGRAKDSDDRTQISLLKMLALTGKGSFIENLKKLNICPLSISYEYDACDYLKTKEMQQKRDDEHYIKSPIEDLISMQTGALGVASEIHYAFTPCINDKLDQIAALKLSRNKEIEMVAKLIDRQIHCAYKIYSSNYIAFDMLNGEKLFEKFYNSEGIINFVNYIDRQVSKIELKDIDNEFCRRKMLEMYANPLKNKIEAEKTLL